MKECSKLKCKDLVYTIGGGILSSLDYKNSGVDVEAADQLVDWLQATGKNNGPFNDRVISGVGGFASLFNIQFPEMKKPRLITCTDGVGTKVLLASYFQSYESVGQDLVAMCVNDLITTGGIPLLFLDYYATSKLDLSAAKSFLQGVRDACFKSRCALVGGETAEMPGVYNGKDFDCAGFAVGIVDHDFIWGAHKVQEGDVLVGIESSGFHSNGYSLLRKVFEKDLNDWKDTLLKPTHLYVELCEKLKKHEIHACAHITGGGIQNLPRVLPEGLSAEISLWELPECFLEVQKRTGMSRRQMLDTFNCGIGMIFVIPKATEKVLHIEAAACGFKSFFIGKVGLDQGQGALCGDL